MHHTLRGQTHLIRLAVWTLIILPAAACGGGDRDVHTGNDPRRAPIPDSVRAELIAMGRDDQRLRADLSPERLQDTLFARELMRGDSVRTAVLRTIVDRYGWPDSARAGVDAAQAAFLILQHSADHEFQKSLAPTLESLAARGEMQQADVAMLVDRVLMNDSLPQRYGTQFVFDNGRWVLHPVENEAELESRRAAMGLPTMAEYVKMMEDFYSAPVVMKR